MRVYVVVLACRAIHITAYYTQREDATMYCPLT
nr:MAG TPA: hypothetical protein [Caudoviricetes sp.]DAH59248.1 MAG TPA: hypothetical protein [Caudoviricetes sp.]DAI25496.1 MAG TPA: hypothetical protein [Caudoviricetes sp.]